MAMCLEIILFLLGMVLLTIGQSGANLQVTIHSFSNPGGMCANAYCDVNICCDGKCPNGCHYYFSLCLRPAETAVSYIQNIHQGNCTTFETSNHAVDRIFNGSSFTDNVFGTPNPITLEVTDLLPTQMNVLQVHIEILDFDENNPSELIDRFVINVTIPINESTERQNYPGIFGLADIDVSFCTSCKSGVSQETTDTGTSPISTSTSALKNTTESDLMMTTESGLMTTESDLVTTESNLMTTESDLVTTESDLVTTVSDLMTTESDLMTTESDLVTTKSDLVTTESDLVTTKSDLVTTESDLVTTESDLMTIEGEFAQDEHFEIIIALGVFVIIFLSLITMIVVVGVYMWRRAKRTSVTSKPSQAVRSSYENGENSHTVPLEDLAYNYDVLTAESDKQHTTSNDNQQPPVAATNSERVLIPRYSIVTPPLSPNNDSRFYATLEPEEQEEKENEYDSASLVDFSPHNDNNNSKFDGYDYENPYWMPADKNEELLGQFKKLRIKSVALKDLEQRDVLGSGAFGTVYRGVWSYPGTDSDKVVEEEVAVKTMENGSSEEDRVKFLQEAAIMGQFSHPNIVKIIGIVKENECKIIMELMSKGSLNSHLPSLRSSYTDPSELASQLLYYSRQVASGMSYLGLRGYVHRDLAARNVLVSKDDICKIGDFGLSRDLNKEDFYMSHGGKVPVKWTAPEALQYRLYSTASDVWSFGCVLYEIWSLGVKPHSHLTNAEVVVRISTGYRLAPPPGCPPAIYHVMMKCWNDDKDVRPVFYEICSTLNLPDIKTLKWSDADVEKYSEASRTIGAPLAEGEELFTELQHTYMST